MAVQNRKGKRPQEPVSSYAIGSSGDDGSGKRSKQARNNMGSMAALQHPVALTIIAALTAVLLAYVWKSADMQKQLESLQEAKNPLDALREWSGSGGTDNFGSNRVGIRMHKEGLRAKHPVMLIPGFVTSGLEYWKGHECAAGSFRTRMWTSANMASSFLQDRHCWMEHMSLNFTTGLDPEGVRLRSAQGLDAVDYFFTGYAVWANAIQALADIGYDSTNMVAMPYDWRLSIPNMEHRDRYFTVLRHQAELFNSVYGEKVVMAGHSWGDNVARAFLHWMEEQQPGWVDKNVAVLVNIAGPVFGVPKAITALLSGEMRETTSLAGMAYWLGETVLSKEDRTLMWRTWGSALGMLPIGGVPVWGDGDSAPDDAARLSNATNSFGAMIAYRTVPGNKTMVETALGMLPSFTFGNSSASEPSVAKRMTAVEATGAILADAGPTYMQHIRLWSSATLPDNLTAIVHSMCPVHCNNTMNPPLEDLPDTDNKKTWAVWLKEKSTKAVDAAGLTRKPHMEFAPVPVYHPLSTPLPNAPNLKVACLYGYGLPSERAFHYKYTDKAASEEGDEAADADKAAHIRNPRIAQSQLSAGATWMIDRSMHAPEANLETGIQYSNGDGTVPLLSLGGMCTGGWQTKKLNPHGVKVVTREYKNIGTNSTNLGDHVKILSNDGLLRDLLKMAAGVEDVFEDKVETNIREIAAKIDWTANHKDWREV